MFRNRSSSMCLDHCQYPKLSLAQHLGALASRTEAQELHMGQELHMLQLVVALQHCMGDN
jgi:hypothetical protein